MPETFPMKVLTVVSLAIVVVDLEVLRKTFVEYFQLKQVLDNEPYMQCYRPQAHLRIVFQCYAIYAAIICTTLTSMLALKCTDQFVETVARIIINLCFMVFGPILLTFVNYGFVHFKQLAFVCTPRGASHRINFTDIILILTCFIMALCVTFTMAMQKTLDMAQQSFQDENSLIYRLASMYFSYQVRQSQERDRQQLRARAEERREQRRIRQAEREQVLTAFQSRHPEITLPSSGRDQATPSHCPRAPNATGASSQASTIAAAVPQRSLLTDQIRANRAPQNADIDSHDEVSVGMPLQTLHSSQQQQIIGDRPDLLTEDYDNEINNNFQVNPPRETNYQYAQIQEEKQLKNIMNSMPEAQLISNFRTLNQQLQNNNQDQSHQTGARINSVTIKNSSSIKIQQNYSSSGLQHNFEEEKQHDGVILHQHTTDNDYEDDEAETDACQSVAANGEQLIKDSKVSSGVSISQASTNLNTHFGSSQVSNSGAAIASYQSNSGDPQASSSVGAVPPSAKNVMAPSDGIPSNDHNKKDQSSNQNQK